MERGEVRLACLGLFGRWRLLIAKPERHIFITNATMFLVRRTREYYHFTNDRTIAADEGGVI